MGLPSFVLLKRDIILCRPHQSTEDDFYGDYFIPKGTIVIANIWEMNRDREIFGDDAHDFNPGRYLDENGKPLSNPPGAKDGGHYSFGEPL